MLTGRLAEAVLKLGRIQPAESWRDFAMFKHCNVMRHLRRRRLIVDVGGRYDDEPVGIKTQQWRLTDAGEMALKELLKRDDSESLLREMEDLLR